METPARQGGTGPAAKLWRGPSSEAHRANFLAAARLYGLGGPLQRRCGAVTKTGKPCARAPLRGGDHCPVHARDKRPIDRDQQGQPLTAREIAKRIRRQAANRQRIAWRRDPWAHGATIAFGADLEHGFREALAHAGQDPSTMPPGVADWVRWKYRLLVLDRDMPEAWAAALGQLRQRIRAAGPPPPGWTPSPAVVSPALAYVVDRPPGPYSKRRRLDRDRTPKPTRAATTGAGKTAWDAPLSAADMERAVVGLVEHRNALAPALAQLAPEDVDGRMRLARAFLALLAGGSHADWLEALERMRSRR